MYWRRRSVGILLRTKPSFRGSRLHHPVTRAAAVLTLVALALPAFSSAQIGVRVGRADSRPGVASSTSRHAVEFIGSVAVEHGGTPSQSVRIMLVCLGRADSVAITDRYGRFRFMYDPAISQNGTCHLFAVLAGFESTKLSIPTITAIENRINVGTIKLSDGRPGVISITSADAPKSARRNLSRARNLIDRRNPKLDEALVALQAAVADYDLYAEAWLELGGVLAKLDRPVEGLDAYGKGINADPRFVLSYRPAIRLAQKEDALDLVNLWCLDAVRVDPNLRDICSDSASGNVAGPEF